MDARNPLRFRCEDLESYVHDLEGSEGEAGTGKGNRRNMLLINKSDLLTVEQRYARSGLVLDAYTYALFQMRVGELLRPSGS